MGGVISGDLAAIHNSTSSGTYLVLVTNSQINCGTTTISNSAGITTRIAASELNGGGISNSGTLTCAGVYDGNFVFHANTCP